MEFNCLNFNNPNIQEWLETHSKDELYQIYVDNNGVIPDYKTYSKDNVTNNQTRNLLNEILPKDYPVENISKLMYSLPSETLAAYFNNVIYLSKNPSKEEVYEEGFHAIFDNFMSPSEKKEALKAGQIILANKLKKDGKSVNEYVKSLIVKYPTIYGVLSEKKAFERAYEEEIVSLYVDYTIDSPKNELFSEKELYNKIYKLTGIESVSLAKVINKLFAFFRKLFNTYKSNQDVLEMLFQNINRGKYVNSVTNGENSINVSPATKLLELRSEDVEYFDELLEENLTIKGSNYTFSSAVTQQTVRNVGAVYFQLLNAAAFKTKKEYIDEAIAQYFSLDETFKPYFKIENDKAVILKDNQKAINDLKEEITSYINLFDGLIELEEENLFENFDKSANETNPFETSYSFALKQRIGKTGVVKNTKIVTYDGKLVTLKQIQSVDVLRVYYSFVRRLGNTLNSEDRFNKLLAFSDLNSNTDTQTFVNQLLMEMFEKHPNVKDLNEGEKLIYIKKQLKLSNKNKEKGFVLFPKNDSDTEKYAEGNIPIVLNQILKGFDLWKRANYAVTYDANKRIARGFDANLDGVQNTQINEWNANMQSIAVTNEFKFPEFIVKNVEVMDADSLRDYIDEVYNYLKAIGISVSYDYVRYSFGETEGLESFNLTTNAVLKNANLKILNEKLQKNVEDVSVLFDTKNLNESITSTFTVIARGNSYFDETIPDSSYKNMENNMIFNYQNGTYHLKTIDKILNGITDVSTFDIEIAPNEFLNRDSFITNNYLLKQGKELAKSGEELAKYIKKGYVFGFSGEGIRQSNSAIVGENNELLEKSKEFEGVSVGNMNDRDLLIYLLNLSEGVQKDDTKTAFTPVYVGNYESSKTFEFVNLPFITDVLNITTVNDVKTVNLSTKAIELYKNEIVTEYYRIMSEGNIDDNIYEKYNSGTTVKVKYNNTEIIIPFKLSNGKKKINFDNNRSLMFSDTVRGIIEEKYLTLPAELILELEDVINKNKYVIDRELINEGNLLIGALTKTNSDAIKNVNENINKGVTLLLDDYINKVNKYEIINEKKTILIDKNYEDADKLKDFVKGDLINNLKKKFISDNINTIALNQLMHGDQALLYKNDNVDMVKRFKGRNGATSSFKYLTIAPSLGINKAWEKVKFVIQKELESFSGTTKKPIELADAQNYGTIEYFRKSMYAQGRLTKNLYYIIEKIKIGEPMTIEDEEMIFDQNLYLTSLKTVGYDGVTYLKKSDTLLSIDITSRVIDATEDDYNNQRDENGNYKTGATREIVKWSDGTYHEIISSQPAEKLHNRRKIMEGWRMENDNWIYKGEDFEFDLSMPNSASKMLNRNVHKGKDDLLDINDNSINSMDLDFYGLQVESSLPHEEITDPTTLMTLALNELSKSGETFIVGNKAFNINELTIAYQKNLSDRDKFAVEQKLLEFKNDINLKDFRESMASSLIKTGGEKQLIEFVSKNIGTTENPEFINLNHPVVINKFISQLLSSFSKNVLSHKRAGDAAVHVSSYGRNQVKKAVEHKVDGKTVYLWEVLEVNSKEYNKALEKTLPDFSDSHNYFPDIDGKHDKHENRVQDEIEKLYKKGELYFIDSLRHNIPVIKNNKITGYFSETLLAKSNINQTGIFEEERYMFSLRIPTQGRQSAVNVMLVNMLPAYLGSVIVNAKEVMELSGHDYDVDKAFILKPEGYYENNTFIKYKETGKALEDYELFIKYQLEHNKQLKKLLNKDVKLSDALIKLKLPTSPKEYVQYKKDNNLDTLNKGVINNFLLEANQMTLATPYTLGKSGLAISGTSMDLMKFGVLKENELSLNDDVEENSNIKISDFVNHSGGAYGGDTFWDIIGREFGVIDHRHYKDESNQNLSQQLKNKGIKANVLTKEQMNKAKVEIKRLLGIDYSDTLQGNLQVRNYYQVANSDGVFAIAKINQNNKSVSGGTNTAVQLGIKLNKPVYVWDIFTEQWYKFNYSQNNSNIVKNNWTKDSPKENSNTAYIFTENINSIGSSRVGGGSAVIRNNPNAIGIVTKKYYVYAEDRATSKVTGGWNQDFQDTKEDFELFKKVNLEQFAKIDKYDSKIFPQGFALDLAKIPTRFAEWLQNELLNRYGLFTELNANKTGLVSKNIQSIGVFQKTETPTLTQNFAGIGSRDIENYNVQKDGKWQPREEYVGKEKEEKAKQAIKNVYQNTLNSIEKNSNKKLTNENIQEVDKLTPQQDIPKYLLSNDGKIFVKENKIPYNIHSTTGHIVAHKNMTVGKKNIGIDVNSTLLSVWLNRLNVSTNIEIKIGNIVYNKFDEQITLPNGEQIRLYEVMDNLISSATDEAKEQLNAKYGLNVDALNSLIPLMFMGGSFSLGIALVNQPIIQAFLALKAKKESAVLSNEELKLKEYSDSRIIQNMLGVDYADYMNNIENTGVEYAPKNYDELYLAQQLRNPNKEYSIADLQILADFVTLGKISQEGTKLVNLIKVNGGLPSDIYAFDKLLRNSNQLLKGSNGQVLNLDSALISPLASELTGKIAILNKLDALFNTLILSKSKLFKAYKEEIEFFDEEIEMQLDKELSSYLISQIYIKELEKLPSDSKDRELLQYLNTDIIDSDSDSNIVKQYNNLYNSVKDTKAFENNALLKKLKFSVNENLSTLSLNQLVKLTDMDMTDLIDSYTYMYGFTNSERISPNEFAKMLFAYYIVKDGWQFQYKGVSKIFPVELFKRASGIIDEILKGNDFEMKNENDIREFKRRWIENIKRLDLIPKIYINFDKHKEIKLENGKLSFSKELLKNEKLSFLKQLRSPLLNYINVNGRIYKLAQSETEVDYREIGIEGTTNITTMAVKDSPFMLKEQKVKNDAVKDVEFVEILNNVGEFEENNVENKQIENEQRRKGQGEISERLLQSSERRDIDRLYTISTERLGTQSLSRNVLLSASNKEKIVSEINKGQNVSLSEMDSRESVLSVIQQKLNDTSTLNGKLFKIFNRVAQTKLVINDTGHFFYAQGGNIYINPEEMVEHLKKIEGENYVDMLLFEELIHVLSNMLVSDSESEMLIKEQLIKDPYFLKKVNRVYRTENEEVAYFEYIRMMVQESITGTNTSKSSMNWSENMLSIFDKLMDFIYSIIATDNTKDLINKHVEYINKIKILKFQEDTSFDQTCN